jgi:hypothetical protein
MMTGDWMVLIVFVFTPVTVALIAFAGLLQILRNREWAVCVSRGWIDPAATRRKGSDSLRWAIVLLFAAVGLTVGIWPVGLSDPHAAFGWTPWMLLGAIPLSLSVGLAAVHFLGGTRNGSLEATRS